MSRTCLAVFLFAAAKASTPGEKAASSAEARFASCAPVHLDSRWRGLGAGVGVGVEGFEILGAVVVVLVLMVVGGVDVRGAWMLGMEGCFGCKGGFGVGVGGLVVVVVIDAAVFWFWFWCGWLHSAAEEVDGGL